MGKEIDPSDVGKFPELIKQAQAEMTTLDVLVCGQCHGTFHLIEQFQEHKGTRCNKSNTIKDSFEPKPVVWAFLLWKAAQLSQEPPNKENSSAWTLYQRWMKLDEAHKETWIVAGRTIQSFAQTGQGQLTPTAVKITKTVVDNTPNSLNRHRQLPQARGIIAASPANARFTQRDIDQQFNALKQIDAKKVINRSPQAKLPVGVTARPLIKAGPISRLGLRTMSNGNDTEEHAIEKILAKRFNPRLKEHEYLIKWERFAHEDNTWEQAAHLKSCPVLLDTFEKQLARQKEQKLAEAAKQKAAAAAAAKEEEQQQVAAAAAAAASAASASSPVTSPTLSVAKKRKNEMPEIKVAPKAVKSNGVTFPNTIKSTETSAEVVITNSKDGKPTGIVKKAGITVNPVAQKEAQVKLIQKGTDSISGVVRVTQNKQTVQQLGNTTVKQVQNRASGIVPKPTNQRNPVAGRSTTAQQLNTSPGASYQTVASPAPKTAIQRVVKNAPNSKAGTPEQKIAALARQGDLKITRKPAGQQHIQSHHQPIQQLQQTANVVMAGEETFSAREDFELSLPGSELVTTADGQLTMLPIGKNSPFLLPSILWYNSANNTFYFALSGEQQADGSVLMTDQDGLQQILATTDDGQQQLIQFVTGEDGTIYQVAGKDEQGQTILIAQGADGEQQCVYVAAEDSEGLMSAEDVGNGLLTVDGQLVQGTELQHEAQQQQLLNAAGEQVQYAEVPTDASQATIPLSVTTDDADSQDGQITAEVVQADLPSPGA